MLIGCVLKAVERSEENLAGRQVTSPPSLSLIAASSASSNPSFTYLAGRYVPPVITDELRASAMTTSVMIE